jgi:hypothetical protein
MGELVWEKGSDGRNVPARITISDFRRYYLQNFPSVSDSSYDDILQDAIDTVYTMFTGINTLWDIQPVDIWYDKSRTCYRLLTAWYVADQYPSLVAGVPVMGAIPLKAKRIDGVRIDFADTYGENSANEDLLESLKSNPWGIKARMMIKAAAKRAVLRNRRFV